MKIRHAFCGYKVRRRGDIIMKYKPSYGDKQREDQKRKKKEEAQNPKPGETEANRVSQEPKDRKDQQTSEEKGAA